MKEAKEPKSWVRIIKENKGAILQTAWGLGKMTGEFYLELKGIYIPVLSKYMQFSGYIDFFGGGVRIAKHYQTDRFRSVEGWIKENLPHLINSLKAGLEGYNKSKYGDK